MSTITEAISEKETGTALPDISEHNNTNVKIPTSTYRIQLHKNFTLRDLHQIIDYLYDLGITAIYAAPILKATPGSVHGYDVVDSHTINPEIGTLEDLKSLSRDLKLKNMLWIQDIVPNHMAFHVDNYR